MRVVIGGSRHYPNLGRITAVIEQLPGNTEVITGGAPGVDSWAEIQANNRFLEVVVMKAEWDKHGKSAGYIRNEEMVTAGDVEKVFAFWDGKSRGTKHLIDLALKHQIDLEVIFP